MRRVAVIASLFIFVSSAYSLTIDSFDDDGGVQSSATGVQVSTVTSSTHAVGGNRALRTIKLGGQAGLKVRLETSAGFLFHSQDAQVSGRSTVVWDGDSNADNINFTGLGGINLFQDDGTAIKLENVFYDYPNSSPIDLTITVYDASNASGIKYSSKTITFNSAQNGATLLIPFADFIANPQGSAADFHNVGAITLDVLGSNPNVDLTIDLVGTNGRCAQVPDGDGNVVDECGVCGGHNEAKDQCGVCFGNNADLDQCGVCFGENQAVDDCGVCFGNNAGKDECNVCGGNNSSCADCLGIPNGPNVIDICNVCAGNGTSCLDCAGTPFGTAKVDACGVCGGNGTSCLLCDAPVDISGTLQDMLNKSKEQYAYALFLLKKIEKNDRKLAAKLRLEIKRVYRLMITQIALIPTTILTCESPQCITVTTNVDIVIEYNKLVVKIYKLSIKILNYKSPKLPENGTCHGTRQECLERQRTQSSGNKTLRKLVAKLSKENITISGKVPHSFTVCPK